MNTFFFFYNWKFPQHCFRSQGWGEEELTEWKLLGQCVLRFVNSATPCPCAVAIEEHWCWVSGSCPIDSLLERHYLHISLQCKLLNCNYLPLLAYLFPYLLTSFPHTVHRFFYCVIDCMFVYPMCNSVLSFLSHCFALSWPGRSCKWELVLNWPTWLNIG